VGGNREGKGLITLAHLLEGATNIFICTYTKGEDALDGIKGYGQLLTYEPASGNVGLQLRTFADKGSGL
jgi:hypothetical protein